MSFAKQLKKVMVEKEMNQTELAAKIGKGKSSVSQYLSGKNIPKEDVQEKIAEVLGCTVEYLNSDPVIEEDDSEVRGNVSVRECARRIGKSEEFVRLALQAGTAPFGFAVKKKSVFNYHISPKKLAEYIGT